MWKKLIAGLSAYLLTIGSAYAICPICTIAVGAGVGLSRWLGVDDTISGIWIGGLAISSIWWTINWLNSKHIRFFGRKPLIVVGYYILILTPFYSTDIVGHPLNTLWGFDKLLLGIVIGSITFFVFGMWYFYMKKKNDGHAHFPFEKVVMPIAPLIILTIFFYFITRV